MTYKRGDRVRTSIHGQMGFVVRDEDDGLVTVDFDNGERVCVLTRWIELVDATTQLGDLVSADLKP